MTVTFDLLTIKRFLSCPSIYNLIKFCKDPIYFKYLKTKPVFFTFDL